MNWPLRHRSRADASIVKPKPLTEDASVQHAMESMKAADRWMQAVMSDANRVFKRGVKQS